MNIINIYIYYTYIRAFFQKNIYFHQLILCFSIFNFLFCIIILFQFFYIYRKYFFQFIYFLFSINYQSFLVFSYINNFKIEHVYLTQYIMVDHIYIYRMSADHVVEKLILQIDELVLISPTLGGFFSKNIAKGICLNYTHVLFNCPKFEALYINLLFS